MLSIIIPHYNSWEKLEELLNTIPINNDIEVIVIDDHSSIPLPTSIKNKFSKVKFLYNEKGKKGAGTARNLGIKHSIGDWVLFADADDKFVDGFFEQVKKYFNSDYDIVFFKPDSFSEVNSITSTRHIQYMKYVENYHNNPSRYNELKLRYAFLVPWSKLIRSNIIHSNNITFEESLVSNDILFSAKTGYYANNIIIDLNIIYKVRQSKTSLTANKSQKRYLLRLIEWKKYILFVKNNLTDEDFHLLTLTGLPQIRNVIKNGYSYKLVLDILKFSKKNGISIIDNRLCNPKFLLKLLYEKISVR